MNARDTRQPAAATAGAQRSAAHESRSPVEPGPVAFVLGTGRCGSTLLHEVLAHHPGVGFVSNVDDRLASLDLCGRLNPAAYRFVPPAATRKGRLRFAPSEAYRLLAAQVSPMLCDPARDLDAADVTPWTAARLRHFVARRVDAQGCELFLHKFTGWPRASFLVEVFPDARFVVVTRDGRAVANSLLQMAWWAGHRGPAATPMGGLGEPYLSTWCDFDKSFVALAGLTWASLVDRYEAVRAGVPARQWLDVRYEDLVVDPIGQVERVTAFLELDRSPDLERRLAQYAFSCDRLDAYRHDLQPEQVKLLEIVQHDQLDRLGYLDPQPSLR